jgi:hypothetical protein
VVPQGTRVSPEETENSGQTFLEDHGDRLTGLGLLVRERLTDLVNLRTERLHFISHELGQVLGACITSRSSRRSARKRLRDLVHHLLEPDHLLQRAIRPVLSRLRDKVEAKVDVVVLQQAVMPAKLRRIATPID